MKSTILLISSSLYFKRKTTCLVKYVFITGTIILRSKINLSFPFTNVQTHYQRKVSFDTMSTNKKKERVYTSDKLMIGDVNNRHHC